MLAAEAVTTKVADDDKANLLIWDHRRRRGGVVVGVAGVAHPSSHHALRDAVLIVHHPAAGVLAVRVLVHHHPKLLLVARVRNVMIPGRSGFQRRPVRMQWGRARRLCRRR